MTIDARAAVAARLHEVVVGAPGHLSVAVTGSDGYSWGHDAERVVPSASTIKLPILVAALAAVESGDLALGTMVPVPDTRVGGSGPLSLLPSVTSLPLGELLALMVALSDNDATNAVVDLVGLPAVAALIASVPTRHTRLRRRMMDFEAAGRGLENETCAVDLVATMSALRQGRLVGPVGTRSALEILRGQQFREGLPAYLPADVEVASKTGELPGLRADVALLERGGRWVAVSVIATGLLDRDADRGTAVLPSFAALGEVAAGLL